MQKWHSDTTMCALFSNAFVDEMELHNDATMENNVATANEWLESNGFTQRVTRCREAASGDELEWLVS